MGKEFDEILHSLITVTYNNNDTDINQKISHNPIVIENEQKGFCMKVGKARDDKKSVQLMIPSLRSLFKTINSFTKFANMIRMIMINKA